MKAIVKKHLDFAIHTGQWKIAWHIAIWELFRPKKFKQFVELIEMGYHLKAACDKVKEVVE